MSCTKAVYDSSPVPCSDGSELPFSPGFGGRSVSILGRAKIVMPKYRVRGICRIRSEPSGGLVIDFEHSSLFGAYREDATIILEGGELLIIDRERGLVYENDASLSMLGSKLAFELFPDDLRYAMLLEAPSCDVIEELATDSHHDRWRLTGAWRDRDIEIEGRSGYGPERFVLCDKAKTDCYIIRYRYNRDGVYPRSIELVKEGGEERIDLEIIDVRFQPHEER